MSIQSPDFITEYATNGIRRLKIVVVGAGGTGSALLGKLFQLHNTLEALSINGLDVIVYDDDVVTKSNLGRQSYYSFDLGKGKAECLVERFNAFGSVNWEYKNERFNEESLGSSYGGVVIFGCVDNVPSRQAIHTAFANKKECVWIDSGNDATSGNIIMAMSANVNKKHCYLPSVVDLYREQIDGHIDNNKDSCSALDAINKQAFGVNDMAAAQSIQLLWQLIRHGNVDYQGVSFDLKTGATAPLQANKDTWAMYGYNPKH